MKEKESEWEDRLDKMGESLNKCMKGLEGLDETFAEFGKWEEKTRNEWRRFLTSMRRQLHETHNAVLTLLRKPGYFKAQYFHCASHCLNFVLSSAGSVDQDIQSCISVYLYSYCV